MSALMIGKRGSATRCTPCVGGCRHKGNGSHDLGVKWGTRRVEILGYPIGALCEACCKTWTRLYADTLAGFPEEVAK